MSGWLLCEHCNSLPCGGSCFIYNPFLCTAGPIRSFLVVVCSSTDCFKVCRHGILAARSASRMNGSHSAIEAMQQMSGEMVKQGTRRLVAGSAAFYYNGTVCALSGLDLCFFICLCRHFSVLLVSVRPKKSGQICCRYVQACRQDGTCLL
jgi:hypothetical protein